jgi:hypothetical protein
LPEKERGSELVRRIRVILEHGFMVAISLLVSLFLALLALFGIFLLDYVTTRVYGNTNPLVDLIVYYSGIEAFAVFILASMSLLREVFTEARRTD